MTTDALDLKAKLGLDVFKTGGAPHIRIRERKATTDNRRDTGTGQQSASRQTPTGQGREE